MGVRGALQGARGDGHGDLRRRGGSRGARRRGRRVDGALDASTRILSDPTADSVARECALRCFGRLATMLERRLAPWLGGVIAAAAASLAAADAAGGFAWDGKSSRAVSAGDASESIAAAEALGSLVNSCGSSTRPHLGVALAALGRAATSPSSPAALRVAAARAIEFSVSLCYFSYGQLY